MLVGKDDARCRHITQTRNLWEADRRNAVAYGKIDPKKLVIHSHFPLTL
jgi:hypothetical protein